VFAEDHARLLLLLHTALAVGAVGASTHLVIWLHRIRRGQHGRLRAARRFAVIAAVLHGGAFVAGNLMYPTYKVRVKVAYLQNPAAVLDDAADEVHRDVEVRRRYGGGDAREPTAGQIERATAGMPERTDRAARWFDAKEHWVAMGLPVAVALALLLPVWRPEPGHGAEIGGWLLGLAVAACLTLWFGAIVGVVTASWRAVG
jgi:hypothetical protein